MGSQPNVEKKGLSEPLLAVLHLLAILFGMVVYGIVSLIFTGLVAIDEWPQWQLLLQLSGQHVLILGGMTFAFVHWGEPTWTQILGPIRGHWSWIVVVALVTPGLLMVEEPLLDHWSAWLDATEPGWYEAGLHVGDWGSAIGVALAVCVLPAVFEELLFRGYVQHRLRSLGVRQAIGLQAVLFSLYHMDLYGLPIYFLSGLALGWLRWASGALWVGIVFHALNNALSVWDYNMDGTFLSEASVASVMTGSALLLGGGGVAVSLYRRRRGYGPPETNV